MCRSRAACLGFALLLSSSTWAPFASAFDDSVKGTVRDLSSQGKEDYDAGRYEQAAEKFRRAYSAIQVPTLALWSARCLANLGKWVSASELYRQATQLERNELWIGNTQQEAQSQAAQELEELLPRIGHLRIVVAGAEASEVTATVDGADVPNSLFGVQRPTDPGQHRIQGVYRGKTLKLEVELEEGETKEIQLRFSETSRVSKRAPERNGAEPGPLRHGSVEARDADAPTGSSQRTLGYVGLGIGLTGVLVGAATGIVVAKRYSELKSNCPNDVCDPTHTDPSRLDGYNTARTISAVGFVVGGVGLAAGAALLLSSPAEPHRVSLCIAPGGASLRGAF